jgi:xanthine dehydrogenase accessory factor
MAESIFYKEIAAILEKEDSLAMATIIDGRGSTPRKKGTKMLVYTDGTTKGTVGGGILEATMIKAALKSIITRKIEIVHFDMNKIMDPDTDSRCGGSVDVLIEPLVPPEPLIIFGGGHVGYAIYNVLSSIDFKITIVDDRKKFATKKRFPKAQRVIHAPYDEAFEKLTINENTHIIVCTRAHVNDEECLRLALPGPACYIGMLGSRTKVERFKKNLRKEGIPAKRLRELHAPIGLKIGAVTPEEIAISVAAELIQVRAKRLY